jgi:hypothetical protein
MQPHVYERGSGLAGFVSGEPAPSMDGPGRRRDSWSLKSIVEDVGGRPIADFQEPGRPAHPYTKWRREADAANESARTAATLADGPVDPVGRVYPPLVGATGRSLHGQAAEHHAETLATVATDQDASIGHSGRSPGPTHRPERIYLHYLLLHLDRLNDAALAYLSQAVLEELRHRSSEEGTAPSARAPPPLPSPAPPDEGDAARARASVQT